MKVDDDDDFGGVLSSDDKPGQLQFLTNKNLINTFTYLYLTPSRGMLSLE